MLKLIFSVTPHSLILWVLVYILIYTYITFLTLHFRSKTTITLLSWSLQSKIYLFSDSWCLVFWVSMFYLPGPAVRPDIFSSNHPGHHRGEGGQATPVGWGDRQRQILNNWEWMQTTVSVCWETVHEHDLKQIFIAVLCVKDTYHQQQGERKPQTSSCLYLYTLK